MPERFQLWPIGNNGYVGDVDLLVPITAPSGLEPGATAPLAASESGSSVCADICIPGEAKLALDVPTGPGAFDPTQAARFAAARALLPVAAPFAVGFAAGMQELRLLVPASALAGSDRPIDRQAANFFPDSDNVIDQVGRAADRTARERADAGAGEIGEPHRRGAGDARRRAGAAGGARGA